MALIVPANRNIRGLSDDLACGAAQIEQRIKGIVIGTVVGAVGTGILFYLYGGALSQFAKR